jgi:anhydro-N-acetylmuramic acid kinase
MSGKVEGLEDGPIWALGLMSGTAMDGVDAAMVLTDGITIDALGPSIGVPYGGAEVDAVRADSAPRLAPTQICC